MFFTTELTENTEESGDLRGNVVPVKAVKALTQRTQGSPSKAASQGLAEQ
jgi:hypothetical protein